MIGIFIGNHKLQHKICILFENLLYRSIIGLLHNPAGIFLALKLDTGWMIISKTKQTYLYY